MKIIFKDEQGGQQVACNSETGRDCIPSQSFSDRVKKNHSKYTSKLLEDSEQRCEVLWLHFF